MPIYEYECEKCGHRFEKIQKFSDAPIESCEKCGGPVHKMQSAPAFQFKGTGWYVTDYARSGKTAAGSEEKKPEPTKTDTTSSASSTAGTPSSSTTETKSGS
jgi:putative FmdB family regulatory protein